MRKTLLVKVILIGTIVICVFQIAAQTSVDEETIKKAVLTANDRMLQAGLDVDKFFESILDFDNGLIIQDGILFRTRQEAYDAVKKGFAGVSKIERSYDQTYVTVISHELALFTGTGMSNVTLQDGRIFSNRFAASLVFIQRDGQWKVLQGHYSVPNQ